MRLDSIIALMRAIDGEPAMSENGTKLRQELEAMMTTLRMAPSETGIVVGPRLRGPASTFEFHTRGWIGITTGDAPMNREISQAGGEFVKYFAHPAIISVDRDSPAQLAGIVAGDSLIAYDGVDVVGRTLNLNADAHARPEARGSRCDAQVRTRTIR